MTHLKDDLFICDKCCLISSNTTPDLSLYDKSYLTKYKRYEKTGTGKQLQDFRYHLLRRRSLNGKQLRILDFGCGSGNFVNFCIDQGHIVSGFDINPYGDYSDIAVLFGTYDVVTFWDSLEHLPDPIKVIKGINAEWIFICTPSTDDYQGADMSFWHHYYPGEHIHYFNKESLLALLTHCGYENIGVDYTESAFRKSGGSRNIITVSAQKRG